MSEERRLVSSEYIDMRYFFAALHVFRRMGRHKERLQLTPGAWKMYRAGLGMIDKAGQMMLKSVPEEDRARLRADLNNSDIYMHTTRVAEIKVDDSDMIFLTRNQMKDVIGYAMGDCQLCDKQGKEVVKCKKRKVLHGLFPHALPIFNGENCLWNDYNVGGGDGRELMIKMGWEDVDRDRELENEA